MPQHRFDFFFALCTCSFAAQEHIRKTKDKEVMAGAAVTGGAILVLGGLVGLGIAALASKK